MTLQTQLQSRRAIEALRSGVPNRDAVQALGSSQPEVEQRFQQQLKAVADGFEQGLGGEGTLVAGDFGSGKSHLLEYLHHVALETNFVCSKVVISKETPLYDPAKVLRAAIESAQVPGKTGSGLTEIAGKLEFNSKSYAEFFQWVNRADNGLSRRFPATVFVFERGRGNREPEIANRIIQFWSGSRIAAGELKQWLKELGEAATYRIDKVSVKDLALQRYQFVPRLVVAAGYAGWVILVDEVELIGRYSLRQRAKSYAEIARLLGKLEGSNIPGLTCLLTITTLFESEVFDDPRRSDEERIPNRLRAGGSESDLLLSSQAERGMRIIRPERDMRTTRPERLRLEKPSEAMFHEIYDKAKTLHGQAYQWGPPGEFTPPDKDKMERVRPNIKRWIHEWDLRRLYPEYTPHIEGVELKEDLSEQPDLETPTETSEGSGREDR